MVILFGLINLAFALLIFFLTLAFVTGAPFVPSTSKVSQKMIELAQIKKGMTIYDLGSGDGRLLFAAEKLGAKAIGYEINPYLVLFTFIKILMTGKQKTIKVYWQNFWTAKLPHADIVFVYLLPWKMKTLSDMLKNKLAKGAKIVSNSFIFPDLNMTDKDESKHVYVFEV